MGLTPEEAAELEHLRGIRAGTPPSGLTPEETEELNNLRGLRDGGAPQKQNEDYFKSPEEIGQYLSDVKSNFIPSAKASLNSMYEAVSNPKRTAESVGDLLSGALQSEPGTGEIFSLMGLDPKNKELAKSLYDSTAERLSDPAETFRTDPFGALLDFSGTLSGVGAVSKAGKIKKAANTAAALTDPLGYPGAIARKLTPSPETLMSNAIKLPPNKSPVQRANIVSTMLREGIMPTNAGLEKIGNKLAPLGRELDDIINEATEAGTKIPINRIKGYADELRVTMMDKFESADDIKALNLAIKKWESSLPKNQASLTPKQVLEFKRDLASKVDFEKLNTTSTKESIRRTMATGAKESLEGLDTRVGPINSQMSDLMELKENLPPVVNRIDNQKLVDFRELALIGAGSVYGGPVGGAVGAGAAIGMKPKVQAALAHTLNNPTVKKVIGSPERNRLTRQALLQSGRVREENDELAKLLAGDM